MSKKNKTPLGIFVESIGLYFSNIDKFLKYMTFPVLGQIAGLLITLFCTYIYSKNLPALIEKYSFFDNFNTLIFCSIIVALPGMIIFVKAFWEYLVAYGAVNSMLDNMLKSGKVYDFNAHTELIKRRTMPFVGLWFLFGIFSFVSVIPIFWVPCGILAIFFVLIFQVFTYEPELSPIGCARKSMQLIHGHFASTFMLMALIGALTYVFIPQIFNSLFAFLNITPFLSNTISVFIAQFPVNEYNQILTSMGLKPLIVENLATFTVTTFIAQIFIQYTLPMRSILWGMWYRQLNTDFEKSAEKKSSKSKRPSEKLMESVHEKVCKNSSSKIKKSSKKVVKIKKLDNNLLRRAMEKEEDNS